MNIEHREFISFLKAAQKHHVHYILVGGFSVVFHGYVRGTKDMDIWLRPSNENRDKLVKVFQELEYIEGVDDLKKSDFKQKIRFTAGSQPFEIDMMTHIIGVEFDDAMRDAAHLNFEGFDVPVLEFHHLKTNKLATMRPKDMNDIRELEKIKLLKMGISPASTNTQPPTKKPNPQGIIPTKPSRPNGILLDLMASWYKKSGSFFSRLLSKFRL